MADESKNSVFTVADVIQQALAELEEDDRKFALRIVCEYHGVQLREGTAPPRVPEALVRRRDGEDEDEDESEHEHEHEHDATPAERSVADAMKAYLEPQKDKPATAFAAHLAFFLKFKAEKKQDHITPKGYADACRIAGRAVPANPRQALLNAKASEYLEDAGRGKYRLTVKGENLARGTLRHPKV